MLTSLTHTCDDNVIYLWCAPCPVLPRSLVAEGPYERPGRAPPPPEDAPARLPRPSRGVSHVLWWRRGPTS